MAQQLNVGDRKKQGNVLHAHSSSSNSEKPTAESSHDSSISLNPKEYEKMFTSDVLCTDYCLHLLKVYIEFNEGCVW
ncbi:hypothetical protein MKX03_037447 [Papaver bracteatum]|nr:hypothetical protein MKX03_037447 [Papaver bracteatum]